MKIDAVVFDLDGTLLDTSNSVPAAYAAAILELSGLRCTRDEVIAQYGAGPAAALLSRFIGRQAVESDVECWHRHLETRLSKTVIYPGIRTALTGIGSAGVPLGVFTGATSRAAWLQLEHAELRTTFDAVVGSDEVGSGKPAPDGIHRICDLLDVSPAMTAYVGDSINDVRCARAAGAISVAAAWGHLYDPASDPDLVASDPHQLIDLLVGWRS